MAEEGQRSPFFYIRQFYIQRFLRIFPIYYLVIIIGLVINLPPAREIWLWLVTYTSNIYITLNNTWIGSFGHFWTLAVEDQFYFFTLGDLGTAMMFAWLIGEALSGFKGPIGRLLEFKPLIYLGKITYDIYVYHNFVPPILVAIFERLGIPFHTPGFISFIISGTISVLIASLSWHLFEPPINNLKNRFPYAARPAAISPFPDLVKVE